MQWRKSGVDFFKQFVRFFGGNPKKPLEKSLVHHKKQLRIEQLEDRQLLSVTALLPENDSVFVTTWEHDSPRNQAAHSFATTWNAESSDATAWSEVLSELENRMASGVAYRPLTYADHLAFSHFAELGVFNDFTENDFQNDKTLKSSASPRIFGPITYAEHLLLSSRLLDDWQSDPAPMQMSCGCGGNPSEPVIKTLLEQDGLFGNASCGGYTDFLEIATGMPIGCGCGSRTRIEFSEEGYSTRFTLIDTGGCSTITPGPSGSNTIYYQGTSPSIRLVPINNAIPDGDLNFTVTSTSQTLAIGCCCSGYVDVKQVGDYTVTIVDDDNWKVDLKHAQGTILDSDGAHVLFEEGETSSTIIISRNDNGLGSDTTYPINVDLNFTGTAIRDSDYKVKNSNGSLLVGNWVTIPKGQTSVTLTIQAIDDNIVERLFESVVVSIVSARDSSGCTFYAIDESALKFKIKDNDTLDLQKVVFTNNLALQSDPDPTTGVPTPWTGSANISHWQKRMTAGPFWKSKQPTLCGSQ